MTIHVHGALRRSAARVDFSSHWAWLAVGLAVAFAVPFLLADVLAVNRDLFYGLYALSVAGLIGSWARSTGYDLRAATRRHRVWATALGLLCGGLLAFVVVRSEEATSRPDGLDLTGALLWRGVVYGVTDGLLLYVLRIGLLGHAMFCAFAPAHFPVEAEFIEAAAADGDFVMRQTQTTVNFRTGRIGALACNGVEYQIEHHLFPGLCHVYYPAVAPVVRDFCEAHGYPYRTVSWRDGIVKSYAALFHPRPIVPMAAPARRAGV